MVNGVAMVVPGLVNLPAGVSPLMTGVPLRPATPVPPAPPPPPPAIQKGPQSIADCKIGDSLEAFGLKGEKEALNNDRGVIKSISGFAKQRRYVMQFTQFVIDKHGELAKKEKLVTLDLKNLRLPGENNSTPSSQTNGNGRRDRGKDSREASRSRSRRRRRRSRSYRRHRSRSRKREGVAKI